MKLYIAVAFLLSAFAFTSCDKTYDCKCTTKGTQSSYVKEVEAQNGDDARDKCTDYQNNTNRTTIPNVECSID